jgi:uncharacterized membrane protein
MNLRRPLLLASLLIAGNAAMAIWAVIRLPPATTIAINYGLDGRPHSFLPVAGGVAIMPAVAALVTLVLAALPGVARNPKGLAASAPAYGLLMTSLPALFLVAQAGLIAQAMDPGFDVLRWVFLAAAVLLMLVGNVLGKVRHNDVFGVRTRWTLADPRVWDKTHRFTGRLMVLGALALAAVAAFMPDHPLLIATLVLAAAGPPLAGGIYSARIAAEQG